MTEFGLEIKELKEDESNLLKKNYFMFTDGVMKLHPGNWILPTNFNKYSHLVYNFELKPTDIYVVTFPKSGTTWMQEIVWNLMNNPDLDNPHANLTLDARFPTFEADMFLATTGAEPPNTNSDAFQIFTKLFPGKSYLDGVLLHLSAFAPAPRMFKSHLPLRLLPPKTLETTKVIYVARDPRDVLSSLYHYMRLQVLWGFRGTLDEFLDDVLEDRILFGPYWQHMKDAWDQRNSPNFRFVYFEDLKNDAFGEIKKIDTFLGTNRSDKQIQNVVEHTSFSQMKERGRKNPPTSDDSRYFNKEVEKTEGSFFRKGEIGDWKNRFSPEQVKKLNAWMAKNVTQFGPDFKYKV